MASNLSMVSMTGSRGRLSAWHPRSPPLRPQLRELFLSSEVNSRENQWHHHPSHKNSHKEKIPNLWRMQEFLFWSFIKAPIRSWCNAGPEKEKMKSTLTLNLWGGTTYMDSNRYMSDIKVNIRYYWKTETSELTRSSSITSSEKLGQFVL